MIREIWKRIEKNCQKVAEEGALIREGEEFRLTDDQQEALAALNAGIKQGKRRLILKAPTGSGKTEVMMRLGVMQHIATSRPVIIIAPTRDLCRQHSEYLMTRLSGTPLENISLITGGIEPRKRDKALREGLDGKAAFIITSAMVIDSPRYSHLLDSASLLVVDDVNAFNEYDHLRHLKKYRGLILYMSATPEAVASFLKSDGAWENLVEMEEKPFDTTPTVVETEDVGNSSPVLQLIRASDRLREHIERGSRIYIVTRLKREVSVIAEYLKRQYSVPVFSLHGDMADSQEHQRRARLKRGAIKTKLHRIPMMNEFRNSCPSILVSTNLIGSGIDIPLADFIVITDSHSFSPSEKEQLIGRVGRRERDSEALLLEGDSPAKEKELKRLVKFSTRCQSNGKMVYSFAPHHRKRGRR
ncbi:MAG: helicase-related protein [Candidatus Eremiobacteraeota bacterium]|nr:helicase-related protein [Candidatus Eremiobacteraeota bacterium]